MLTNEQLERDKELESRATPGPWDYRCADYEDFEDDQPAKQVSGAHITPFLVDCGEYMGLKDDDAAFIARARTALPEYRAEIVRLKAALKEMSEAVIGLTEERALVPAYCRQDSMPFCLAERRMERALDAAKEAAE